MLTRTTQLILCLILTSSIVIISCKKDSSVSPSADPCAGKTITVTATIAPASSAGATDGEIKVVAAGGTAPYTYSKNGGAYQAIATFNSLPPGNYTISAKDANGCTGSAVFSVLFVNAPVCSAILISGTAVNPTSSGGTDGKITITMPTGANFQYSKDGATFQANPNFDGLAPGHYTITIKNTTTNCLYTKKFTVKNFSCPSVTVTTTYTSPTTSQATDGKIKIKAPIGIQYEYKRDGFGGNVYQTSPEFTGLSKGLYTITVRNKSNNCTYTGQQQVYPAVTISFLAATVPTDECANNTGKIVIANVTGGKAPYTYSKNGGAPQASNIFDKLPAGAYTIVVKDADGYTSTKTTTISKSSDGPLFTKVKALVATNCVSCHKSGGTFPDFTVKCNIPKYSSGMKSRAITGNMGGLNATQKTDLQNWLNAGAMQSK